MIKGKSNYIECIIDNKTIHVRDMVEYLCLKKKRYLSYQDAKRRAKYFKRLKKSAHPIRAYKCNHCQGYHVGNTRTTFSNK